MNRFSKYENNGYVHFDWNSGLKLRYQRQGKTYDKSETPELVDIKITDSCPFKCIWCYQASLPAGKHGSLDVIKRSIDMLSEMNVFEIAIGGGEPVTHPNFSEILEYCVQHKVKPSFTCFGKDWLKDMEILTSVQHHVGGIGVSIHEAKQYKKYHKIKETCPKQLVMAQHVLGTLSYEDTLSIVNNVDHILFLGYKTVGFANNKPDYEYNRDQLKSLISVRGKNISIDTAFADRYKNDLIDLGIDPLRMVAREGSFSCYIDAVDELMSASSYNIKSEMDLLVSNTKDFKEQYAKY